MTAALPRIVHLASGREWRGGQRQVLLLARALQRRGIEQIVVTTRGSRLADELAAAAVPTKLTGWHSGFSIRALAAGLAEARSAPAILHAHDAHALTLAGIVGTLTRTPFVSTRRVDFHLRHRGFWVRADRLIAISEAVRDVLIADGVRADRISVVHSGIDVEATAAIRPGGIRAELGLPDGPLAVTVGALVGHKDHDTLVRAAAAASARHPELHWAIAGEGPLREALTATARNLGVDRIIHFLGQVAEPLRLIRAASLFVMSSKEEGLGTSVLDAMALGVPVVATRAGGLPEMLEGGAGILVEPQNPAGLAAGVSQVLTQPDLAASAVAKARATVDRFSADAMAEGVLQVYRSVVIER